MSEGKGFFTASLIFADIKGFTALERDSQLVDYYETLFPSVCNKIKSFSPVYINSWGDAIFCVFEDPIAAADSALAIRDFFRSYNWTDTQLPKLQVRVSVHSGRAYRGKDPITEEPGYIGTQINLAARIEPIVKPGEVWTTDKFVSLLETANPVHFSTDNLGVKPLAKKWGGQEIYRLRHADEAPLTDENIYEKVEVSGVDPVSAVLALYERGDDQQKLSAVDMMGKKDDPRVLEKLSAIVQDGSLPLNLRLMGIAGMGEVKNSKALPTLASVIDTKENEDPRIHIACIKAIASIGDLRSGTVLQSVLEHRKDYADVVVLQAIEALAFLKFSPAILHAVELLKEEGLDARLAQRIMAMLAVSGDERCIAAVLPYLNPDHSADERVLAMQVIVKYDPKCIKDNLITIARDTNEPEAMRAAAFAGLAKLDTVEAKSVLAEIVERAESSSAMAVNYLVEGKERVEKQERQAEESIKSLLW